MNDFNIDNIDLDIYSFNDSGDSWDDSYDDSDEPTSSPTESPTKEPTTTVELTTTVEPATTVIPSTTVDPRTGTGMEIEKLSTKDKIKAQMKKASEEAALSLMDSAGNFAVSGIEKLSNLAINAINKDGKILGGADITELMKGELGSALKEMGLSVLEDIGGAGFEMLLSNEKVKEALDKIKKSKEKVQEIFTKAQALAKVNNIMRGNQIYDDLYTQLNNYINNLVQPIVKAAIEKVNDKIEQASEWMGDQLNDAIDKVDDAMQLNGYKKFTTQTLKKYGIYDALNGCTLDTAAAVLKGEPTSLSSRSWEYSQNSPVEKLTGLWDNIDTGTNKYNASLTNIGAKATEAMAKEAINIGTAALKNTYGMSEAVEGIGKTVNSLNNVQTQIDNVMNMPTEGLKSFQNSLNILEDVTTAALKHFSTNVTSYTLEFTTWLAMCVPAYPTMLALRTAYWTTSQIKDQKIILKEIKDMAAGSKPLEEKEKEDEEKEQKQQKQWLKNLGNFTTKASTYINEYIVDPIQTGLGFISSYGFRGPEWISDKINTYEQMGIDLLSQYTTNIKEQISYKMCNQIESFAFKKGTQAAEKMNKQIEKALKKLEDVKNTKLVVAIGKAQMSKKQAELKIKALLGA